MHQAERTLAKLRAKLTAANYGAADADLFVAWARAASITRPVLFAGAGVSLGAQAVGGGRPTRLPAMWRDLERRMRADLGSLAPDDGVSALWLAQVYQNALGPNALLQLLNREIPDARLEPGALHRALARIAWEAVITTNYDSLLERAYDSAAVRVVSRDHELASSRQQGCLEILHPHGSFSDTENLVFTLDSYRTFASKRPGLLAKIKQLLLQHPVLFVGFGASDPNFVEWAGWVGDVASGSQPLWLSLDVSKERRAEHVAKIFPGIRFFPVSVEKATDALTGLVSDLAAALSPSAQHWSQVAREDIDEATSADEVVDALQSAMEQWRDDPLSSVGMGHLVDQALERIVRISGRPDADFLAKAVFELSFLRRQDPELLKHLRHAIGKHWTTILEILLESAGLSPRIGNVLVDISAEDEMKENRFLQVRQALESLPESLAELEALEACFSPRSMHFERLAHEVWRRALLRRGSVHYPNVGGPTAMDQRYAGHLAVLRSDYRAAASAYQKAVWTSKRESEPLWLQSLTATSAWHSLQMLRFEPGGRAVVVPTLDDQLRSLRLSDEVANWNGHVREALRKTIETMRDAEIAGVRWNPAPYVPAERIVDVMETHWIAPALIKPIAVTAAQAMLYGSARARAIALMTRYGEEESLRHSLRRMVRMRSTEGVGPEIFDELYVDATSASELCAKAVGLTELVTEIRDVDRAVKFARVGLQSVSASMSTVGGGHSVFPRTVFIDLLQALAATFGVARVGYQSIREIRPTAIRPYGVSLPWLRWIETRAVTHEQMEQWWLPAIPKYRRALLEISVAARAQGCSSPFLDAQVESLLEEDAATDGYADLRAAVIGRARGPQALAEHLSKLSGALARSEITASAGPALRALAGNVDSVTDELVAKLLGRLHVLEGQRHTALNELDIEAAPILHLLAARETKSPSSVAQTIVRWSAYGTFFLYTIVSVAPALLSRHPELTDNLRRCLAGALTDEPAVEQQKAGLAALSNSMKTGLDVSWISDVITLTGSSDPDVVILALNVLSHVVAVSTLESLGYGKLVISAFERASLDGRATVRAALVRALRHWQKSPHSEVDEMLRRLRTDPRPFVQLHFETERGPEPHDQRDPSTPEPPHNEPEDSDGEGAQHDEEAPSDGWDLIDPGTPTT